MDIGKKTGDGLETGITHFVTNKEMDGFVTDGPGKKGEEAVLFIDNSQHFTEKVDIVKLGSGKEVTVAGVKDVGRTKDGDREAMGAFSKDAGGFFKESVKIGAVIPDALLDGDFFGNTKVTLFHELVNVELDGGSGGKTAGRGVWFTKKSLLFEGGHFITKSGGGDTETKLAI